MVKIIFKKLHKMLEKIEGQVFFIFYNTCPSLPPLLKIILSVLSLFIIVTKTKTVTKLSIWAINTLLKNKDWAVHN